MGEFEAAKIVRDLLVPVTTRKLEANGRDLPLYAEAAPAEFLDIIERDLRAEKSEVMGFAEAYRYRVLAHVRALDCFGLSKDLLGIRPPFRR